MSLNIYIKGIDSIPSDSVEMDIDILFSSIRLDGCDYDRHIISVIDGGEYVSNLKFKDRFGDLIKREYLSTGSKAALILYHAPDVILFGVEIGFNALTEIVKKCTVGNLLLENSTYYIEDELEPTPIDVNHRGRHFSFLSEFSEYIAGGV